MQRTCNVICPRQKARVEQWPSKGGASPPGDQSRGTKRVNVRPQALLVVERRTVPLQREEQLRAVASRQPTGLQ